MNWREFVKENEDWVKASLNENEEILFYKKGKPDTLVFTISPQGYNLFDFSVTTIGEQDNAIDFLHEEPAEWYEKIEAKYNIILGKDLNGNGNVLTIYRKTSNGVETDFCRKEDLSKIDNRFSQFEIDIIKSELPEKLAKIVDLAKTEVKTDE